MLTTTVVGQSLKTAGYFFRKVEKTPATQGGYQQVSCLLCKYHDFRGGFSARDVTYLRRAGTARPISAQTAGRDTKRKEKAFIFWLRLFELQLNFSIGGANLCLIVGTVWGTVNIQYVCT